MDFIFRRKKLSSSQEDSVFFLRTNGRFIKSYWLGGGVLSGL